MININKLNKVGGKIAKLEQQYIDFKILNLKDMEFNKVLEVYGRFRGFELSGDNDLIIKIASLFYNIFRENSNAKEVFEDLIQIVLTLIQLLII